MPRTTARWHRERSQSAAQCDHVRTGQPSGVGQLAASSGGACLRIGRCPGGKFRIAQLVGLAIERRLDAGRPGSKRIRHCVRRGSIREPEVHDVAVLDDVLLAFEAHLAGFLGADLAAERHEVVVGDGLGADEALLEVGVDDAGGLAAPWCRAGTVQARASLGPTVK